MLDDLWLDCVAWWATVTPEFAFLLALPFGVAALGGVREACGRSRSGLSPRRRTARSGERSRC